MTALRNVWAVLLREVAAYFLSPVAWIVITLFLLVNGATFSYFTSYFQGHPRQITLVVESLFGFALFWILPLSPILTMRLFAEEKRTGSLELLMTAPVTEAHVALGKFLAAQAFYCLIWASLLPFFAILDVLGEPDWGPILTTYTGVVFLGLLTNALGCLASAWTRNQLVSAIVALSGNLLLFYVTLAQGLIPADAIEVQRVLHYLSFTHHFDGDFFQGSLDVRYLFFYGSLAASLIFLSVLSLEARKWR
ncbi:MAG: ABC transporter permease subunit [Planctomycetes bacterium]|nr:ABC transporter permease subunit [Planctomycetota bacterium]